MITFLALPRAFADAATGSGSVGEFDTIQRNAIRSWQESAPGCQVILFGDEAGVAETACELGCTHLVEITRGVRGAPLVDSIFLAGEALARHGWICFCSADVQLAFDASLLESLAAVERPFVIGQRWDVEQDGSVCLHAPCGVDYFLYRKGTIGPVLPFTVRGGGGDNWMVHQALNAWQMTVIDATATIRAVHYAHSHPEWMEGKAGRQGSAEQLYNHRLLRATGITHFPGVDDAPWLLLDGQLVAREMRNNA